MRSTRDYKVTVRFCESLLERLDFIAGALGKSRSETIRILVEGYQG